MARSTLYRPAKPPSALQQRLEEAAKAIHKAMPFAGTRKMAEMLTEHVGVTCRRDRSRSIMRKLHLHPLRVIKGCTRHAAGAQSGVGGRHIVGTRRRRPYVPVHRDRFALAHVPELSPVKHWRCRPELRNHALSLSHYGTPQLFNSDKGSTYTAGKYQTLLRHNSIVASMTGERGWKDNPIAERIFASIKGECTKLFEFADGEEARAGIGNWQMKYNFVRPHMSLSQRTPASVYWGNEKIISCGARNPTVSERARELFDSFFIS